MHVINAVFFLMCVSSFSSISEAESSPVLEQTNPDMAVETENDFYCHGNKMKINFYCHGSRNVKSGSRITEWQ